MAKVHGQYRITGLEPLEMSVDVDSEPPAPLDVALIIALPRPKVLNRVVAGATSLGVKRIYLMNSWRVEKSYWKSPRLSDDNLRLQSILGLEQARDTILPTITMHRFFRELIESEIFPGRKFVAHPYATASYPAVTPATLAIGPEGGFIAKEIESLEKAGFEPITLGPRILRVETAISAILGRHM